MAFLTPADYTSQIRDEIRDILTDLDEYTQQDAELKAQAQLATYLHRYDVAAIFIDVPAYVAGATYNEGDTVYYLTGERYKLYVALAATTGNLPTSAEHWKLGDSRNKHIVRLMVDIALYILHYGNSPRSVPEHILNNYNEALKWAEMVSRGTIGPDLPTLPEDTGIPFKWGSEPKQGVYW